MVPGWLDKPLKHRHRASPQLDNVVVLAPRPDWVTTLPGGKLPDRSDFKAYWHDRRAHPPLAAPGAARTGREPPTG